VFITRRSPPFAVDPSSKRESLSIVTRGTSGQFDDSGDFGSRCLLERLLQSMATRGTFSCSPCLLNKTRKIRLLNARVGIHCDISGTSLDAALELGVSLP